MANSTTLQKAEDRDQRNLAQKQLADAIADYPMFSVRQYKGRNDVVGQFIEYFYPWELLYLKTNDFETITAPKQKCKEYFQNGQDLQEYLENLSSLSSNNEDRPPPSELLFCASSIENVYEDVMLTTKYVPRLTHLQCALLHDLAAYVLSYDDSSTVAKCIIERRLDLIRGFCKKLKRKRYAKAYCRFRDIRSKRLAVDDEALELLIAEMFDKDLSRPFYFDQNEPKELSGIVLETRRTAIKRKYLQYAMDPAFRQAYQKRVYYNVNKDLNPSDAISSTSCDMKETSVLYKRPIRRHMPQTMQPRVRLRAGAGRSGKLVGKKIVQKSSIQSPDESVVNIVYTAIPKNVDVASNEKKTVSDPKSVVETDDSSLTNNEEMNQLVDHIIKNSQSPSTGKSSRPLTKSAAQEPSDFDANLSRQFDSDIPTSEAECMSDYGASISPRVRSRRKRLLKALHRLLRVEQMDLNSIELEAKQLCELELDGKQLRRTDDLSENQTEELIRQKRISAIRKKYNKFVADPSYREAYLMRIRAIKSAFGTNGSPQRSKLHDVPENTSRVIDEADKIGDSPKADEIDEHFLQQVKQTPTNMSFGIHIQEEILTFKGAIDELKTGLEGVAEVTDESEDEQGNVEETVGSENEQGNVEETDESEDEQDISVDTVESENNEDIAEETTESEEDEDNAEEMDESENGMDNTVETVESEDDENTAEETVKSGDDQDNPDRTDESEDDQINADLIDESEEELDNAEETVESEDEEDKSEETEEWNVTDNTDKTDKSEDEDDEANLTVVPNISVSEDEQFRKTVLKSASQIEITSLTRNSITNFKQTMKNLHSSMESLSEHSRPVWNRLLDSPATPSQSPSWLTRNSSLADQSAIPSSTLKTRQWHPHLHPSPSPFKSKSPEWLKRPSKPPTSKLPRLKATPWKEAAAIPSTASPSKPPQSSKTAASIKFNLPQKQTSTTTMNKLRLANQIKRKFDVNQPSRQRQWENHKNAVATEQTPRDANVTSLRTTADSTTGTLRQNRLGRVQTPSRIPRRWIGPTPGRIKLVRPRRNPSNKSLISGLVTAKTPKRKIDFAISEM